MNIRSIFPRILSCLLVMSLVIPMGLRAAPQNSHTNYLPIIAQNRSTLPPGYTSLAGVTNGQGNVTFTEPNAEGEIIVTVQDAIGNKVAGADVHFLSNGSEGRALVLTQNQHVGWGIVEYPNDDLRGATDGIAVDPFTVGLIVIASSMLATAHIAELTNDPPRIDLEMGYVRLCMTYNAFKHLVGAGLAVFHLKTAAVHSAKIFLGRIGAEKAVTDAAPYILEATGAEWPWQGTWCFRVIYNVFTPPGILWLIPETDTIRHAEFRVVLRWDKGDTDVDLHIFDSSGNHAYYFDKQGVPGGELDRDDVDGWGPETYRQISYLGADYYDIRVHYFSDHRNGPTTATVERFDDEDRRVGLFTRQLFDEDWWTVDRIVSPNRDAERLPKIDFDFPLHQLPMK